MAINSNRIALVGKARTGKDTLGAHLCEQHNYVRVSIAESLRNIAAGINPYVAKDVRYQDALNTLGYEEAKNVYPEVRAYLQRLGDSLRGNLGDRVFLDGLEPILSTAGSRIIVTDCRLPEEAKFLRERGFSLVRIVRADATPISAGAQHITETLLDSIQCDSTIFNNGTMEDLYDHAAMLVKPSCTCGARGC